MECGVLLVCGSWSLYPLIAKLYSGSREASNCRCRIVQIGGAAQGWCYHSELQQMNLPVPHYQLLPNNGSKGLQIDFEEVCRMSKPSLVMSVDGDPMALHCSQVAHNMNLQAATVACSIKPRNGKFKPPKRLVVDYHFYQQEPQHTPHGVHEDFVRFRIPVGCTNPSDTEDDPLEGAETRIWRFLNRILPAVGETDLQTERKFPASARQKPSKKTVIRV